MPLITIQHAATDAHRRVRHAMVVVLCGIVAACEAAPHSQGIAACSDSTLQSALETVLRDVAARNHVPGISLALHAPAHSAAPVAATYGRISDDSLARPLQSNDRMLAGSVGKTFFSALALRRFSAGELALDQPVERTLPDSGIRSLAWITPRMLLSHTSGIGEYDEAFMMSLINQRSRARRRDDWLDVLRRNPPAQHDSGVFRYSDLNYVLLAMVLDDARVGGAYAAIDSLFLGPLQLNETVPSVTPDVPGLVAGYDGARSMFGRDAMMQNDTLIYNPQFEWGGGGFASSASDLARWMTAVRTGSAFPDSLWSMVVARPPLLADSVRSWRGLGVHVDSGSLGTTFGHSGYMPGYVSWMRWYEDDRLSIAMQINASDSERLIDDGFDWMDSLVVRLRLRCGGQP